MAFLEQFSQDERDRIVALPYRAGLWVSSSDATGGVNADEQELAALEKSIAGIVGGMFESAFVHEIIAETFMRKNEWSAWSAEIQTVPHDCAAVVAMLKGRVPHGDIDAYRHILMQIGLEVARAFREYGGKATLGDKIVRGISMAVDRLFGVMHGEKFVSGNILNVSYEEDIALNTLARALRGEVQGKPGGVISHS